MGLSAPLTYLGFGCHVINPCFIPCNSSLPKTAVRNRNLLVAELGEVISGIRRTVRPSLVPVTFLGIQLAYTFL